MPPAPSGPSARRRSRTFAAVAVAAAGVTVAGSMAAQAVRAPAAAAGVTASPAALVNPFIGTSNGANDFPGADAPFGMVQWSPDTTSRPPGGGYYYGDTSITGFSLTHLPGPGCKAAGDLPVLPVTGAVNTSTLTSAADAFSHANESAQAGYYKVALVNGITTELTATTRTGMARFTIPASTQANMVFKLSGSQNGDTAATFTKVSGTEVDGSVTGTSFCGAATSHTLYFDMQFSQPFDAVGAATAAGAEKGVKSLTVTPAGKPRSGLATVPPSSPEPVNHPAYHGMLPRSQASTPALTGPAAAYVTFPSAASTQTVLAKVGVSYASAADAAANLSAENPGWDFGSTEAATQAAWNSLLGKIQVSGGSAAQQQIFYTALYHALLEPSVFSDDNGDYLGADGAVHHVDSGHTAFYTDFSGWDIYRSQAQLEALVDPSVAGDTAQSMVDDYEQTGMLPKWMEDNGETYIMVGDPADAILADYYTFGATGFDTSAALNAMVAEATKANQIRPGLNYLNAPGYMPADGSYGCCNFYGPVSSTLEDDTADFAISAFAGALGDTSDQQAFLNRAQDWRNVLNPDSGLDQPREANGRWAGGFGPDSETGFVEGDSWQYTGMVPFDLAGFSGAKGGRQAMITYLDSVLSGFEGSRDSTRADMRNEPSLGLPWEYDYAGEPYKTQQVAREIQDRIWADAPAGLPGNDDLGEMSSWFVWSALGMYPETPGTADLALGSPLFSQAVVTLPSGRTLTIDGNGAADNAPYVQSLTWNGSAWDDAYAPVGAITSGGTLDFTLGTAPDTSWASAPSQAPPSYGGDVVAPPEPRTGPIRSGVTRSMCMDDPAYNTANGTRIDIWSCAGSSNEEWAIAPDGTIRVDGECLDVYRSGTANGTPVDLYSCNGTGAQQWRVLSSGELVNPGSGKCLDDPAYNTADGTKLDIWACAGSSNERWTLPAAPPSEAGPVRSVSAGKCLDDPGYNTANGTRIDIWACVGSSNERWTVEPDGTLRVSGKCLDIYRSGTANGTPVDLYSCNGTGAQQWQALSSGELVNPHSGKCLDDPGYRTANGTKLDIWSCAGSSNERWTLPS